MKPTYRPGKKALICCTHFWPSAGGVEVAARRLAEDLVAEGWSVTILTAQDSARAASRLGEIAILEHSGPAEDVHRWAKYSREVACEIGSGRYDACLLLADPLNWVFSGLDSVKVPPLTRVICQPLINEDGLRLWGNSQAFRDELARRLRRASAVTTLTRAGIDAQCCEALGITPQVIPNSVPLRQGRPYDFRARHGIPADSFLMLQVANFWPVKNHVGLLRQVSGMAGDWAVALIGNPAGHPEYLNQIDVAVAREPRVRTIQGLGPDEVASAMQAADLLLVPSLGEVAPIVVLEAMSHGLPWLATPACGSVWEHAGGVIAELTEFSHIIRLLLHKPAKTSRLGELGYQHWKSSYMPEITFASWAALLDGAELPKPATADGEPMEETTSLANEIRANAGVATAPKRRSLATFGWRESCPVTCREPMSATRPLVSVIVTTKDRPILLADALHSLVEQTYTHWEAVVVNDGGEDVAELVAGIDPEKRIRYLRHPRSRGLPFARNTGIAFSTGDVLCYLDDDDRLLPAHLDTVVSELQRTGRDVVFTEAECVTESMCGEQRIEHERSRPYGGIVYSKSRLHVANFIPVNTIAHRRELLARTGTFDTSLQALEDWDLLLRFARETEFHAIPRVTAEVRTRLQSGSDHMSSRQRAKFPDLFRRIYARYPVDFAPGLEAQRRCQIEALDADQATAKASDPYARWVEKHELRESDAQYMAERMMLEWRSQPLFHLLVVHEPGDDQALADTLDSLAWQLYKGWGLSVISSSEAPEGLAEVPNIEWLTTSEDGDEAANAVAEQSSAEWILRLETGATLAPEALFSLADYSQKCPEWQVIYADEDRVGSSGDRSDPHFKPDFNLDLLRSTHYMGAFVAIRRELLVRIGGYRSFRDATTYDLVFRALETVGELSIGHIAKVLFHRSDRHQLRKDEALESELSLEVVRAHLGRVGVDATVRPGVLSRTQDVEYAFGGNPKVSVIIPTRDQALLLKACVDSILSITNYPAFEVLVVDNGSTEPAAIAYLNEVSGRDLRVRVLRYDRPYSFSAINNFAAENATGELILLLNNDTQVLHDDWMHRMVGHAMRPEVGAVGARLVFPNGTIQHAGIALGMMGTADHPEIGTPMLEPGYMGRLQLTQNWSAVTAACLMVRRDLYWQVGGLDEKNFNVLFNDVDLCLKLREAGYKNVWTPHATLVHHASVSLKATASSAVAERALGEREALHGRWGTQLATDPAFNRHLSLSSQKVQVETAVDSPWDPIFRERPRVMAFPLDSQGTGHYRVWGPLHALERAAVAQVALLPTHGYGSKSVRVPSLPELLRAAPETLFIQHGYFDLFLDSIERYRRNSSVFLVFGQDDNVLNVPDRNSFKKSLIGDLEGRLERALGLCDRLIVTTEPLVDVYRKYIGDIRVVPNQLDGMRWNGLKSRRRAGRKPRVGWAGALQHLGDLAWLEPVVEALSGDVEWVFMGMCPDNLRPYVAEFHEPVIFTQYPEKLASLDLDLAIAPLEIHPFNEAKSDLRILEYGVLGWPVVATDIYPYQRRPVTCVPNDPDRWISAIRERIGDLDALGAEGDRLREWVLRNRLLENNVAGWLRALFSDEVLRRYGVSPAMAA